jgi:sulfate/thiosulfate-binding protein
MKNTVALRWIILVIIALSTIYYLLPHGSNLFPEKTLLNVSYDPTRGLYDAINIRFIEDWKKRTGEDLKVYQSHGGSGKQARGIIDGLPGDVVTLALSYDIDMIATKTGKIPADWQNRLPHNSSPYISTILFLVRKGNPKNIRDWDDLIKTGVQVITPNPKTSGGARWNYLAAWAYANKKFHGDEAIMKGFMARLFDNVPVLDTGARGSTTTFIKREIGDVLITWENEAFLAINEVGKDQFEIVVPSMSVLVEPPVAVVDGNAARKGNIALANAYLRFLYTEEAQEIIARNYYRPINETVLAAHADQFPTLPLARVEDFGGWKKVQERHFSDGGVFDEIMRRD